MGKLLIIDKNRFQAISEELMCQFVRDYNVVIPYVLCIECLMSKKRKPLEIGRDPMFLVKRLDSVIKAGAKVGYSSTDIFTKENTSCIPVDSIIDKEATQSVKTGVLDVNELFVKREAEKCKENFQPYFDTWLEVAKTLYKNIKKKGLQKNFSDEVEETDITKRMQKWLKAAEKMMPEILKICFPKAPSNIRSDWYTWHMALLIWAWAMEWGCIRSKSGVSFENYDISNDIFDIEYVSYLSRANGILTGDEELVQPLARAAFPGKDVFSSLDEVPEDYKCNWT
ncbi:MAG: hypothetical protein A2173_02030 [Planctomycetes bacterium RBG_13_44_8b]|nr:MAG: hypothetical protein A2173_02030 [Planctomycetes bacterium RBG_13_44_8b]